MPINNKLSKTGKRLLELRFVRPSSQENSHKSYNVFQSSFVGHTDPFLLRNVGRSCIRSGREY